MQSLKRCWERAELLLETARQRPNKIRALSTAIAPPKWKSIYQKLTDLYVEECNREPKQKYLRNATHLLSKLVARDKLGCLVVNLYPGNEGYSVMLKGWNGVDTETMRLPYEEAELLQYIDNEELPPVLVDILECSQVNIFYSGCVIAEVRDYRRSSSPTVYESHHVLLRPTTQTLICDVNALTSDGSKWTLEDRLALESHLLLATQEPLCLEPSPTVALVANYLQHGKHKFGMAPIKSMAKHFSQAAINRKWKFEQHAAPPNLKLYDFLTKHRDKSHGQSVVHRRIGNQNLEMWTQKEVELSTPDHVDVENYALAIPKPVPISENSSEFVEAYTLESKQANGKGYFCKLSIHLRTLDDVFLGELYTDRDYIEGQLKGAMCRFELGTRDNVEKYLHQFIEIFTQESRKAVKITHDVKGKERTFTTIPGGQSISFPLVSATSLLVADSNPSTSLSKRPLINKLLPSPTTANSVGSPPVAAISAAHNLNNTGSVGTAQEAAAPQGSASARTGSRQNTSGQRSQSRPSSVSPGPVALSPGHASALQSRAKNNPTPPPSSRTPTPTLTAQSAGQNVHKMPSIQSPNSLLPSLSPPMVVPNARRSHAADVAPSIGLLSRIQPNLTGFIPADPAGTTLAPVSLTGMPVPPGMAVPISLAMMASNPSSLITTPAGIIVSPISNIMTGSTVTGGPLSPPGSAAGIATLAMTNTVPSSTLVVTSGITPSSPVLTASANVVSFPVGLTGSLTNQNIAARLMTSNFKGVPVGMQQSGTGTLGLFQVAGTHPPASLFSPGGAAQRTSVSSKGNGTSPHTLPPCITPPTSGPTPPPASIAISPTLMTLSSQQQLHLAIQQQNQQIASMQLQQLRHQGGGSAAAAQAIQPSKMKGRKRGGTTPPK